MHRKCGSHSCAGWNDQIRFKGKHNPRSTHLTNNKICGVLHLYVNGFHHYDHDGYIWATLGYSNVAMIDDFPARNFHLVRGFPSLPGLMTPVGVAMAKLDNSSDLGYFLYKYRMYKWYNYGIIQLL